MKTITYDNGAGVYYNCVTGDPNALLTEAKWDIKKIDTTISGVSVRETFAAGEDGTQRKLPATSLVVVAAYTYL
jgi:hypothetical protein